MSEVMQEHLQKLISQWYMIVEDLATFFVPVDPAFPALVGGYVMACVVFYLWGFCMPWHQFLYSLLWSYDLELHHLTPSRILHMVAFVTLCETSLGLSLILTSVATFFRPDYDRARMRDRCP
jgi:hypothetical protein